MAPKIDPKSDPYLMRCYDDLYNRSADFKTRLHNVVTSARGLKLVLEPGQGNADYDMTTNTIRVWRQVPNAGVDKTDVQVRDDMVFELHNARKDMNLNALYGSNGYNKVMLVGDVKKAAGYALAVEWTEWINVVDCTILVNIINAEPGAALLSNPPEFRSQFNAGPATWLKFSNYLNAQVQGGHTASYDDAATDQSWKGFDVLRVLTTGRSSATLEILATEIDQLFFKSRSNPFKWDQIKALQLG